MPKKVNKHKRKRILFISISFLISIIALILIISNFKENIVFFYSPSELESANIKPNKIIRVGGLVKEGSVSQSLENGLTFIITDNKDELRISFKGIKPDLFREGQGMVAKGKLDENNNIFIATELLAKHDENYMPPEVKRSLEKNKDKSHNTSSD